MTSGCLTRPHGNITTDMDVMRRISIAVAQSTTAQSADQPIPTEEALEQPVATAIVTSDLGVLVGRRNDGKPPWTFIAGEVEPGETPERRRRARGEGGDRLPRPGRRGDRRADHPKTGGTMIYMAATPTHGTEVFVGDEDELAEVRWVGLAEADELMAAYGMFGPVHDYLAREMAPEPWPRGAAGAVARVRAAATPTDGRGGALAGQGHGAPAGRDHA